MAGYGLPWAGCLTLLTFIEREEALNSCRGLLYPPANIKAIISLGFKRNCCCSHSVECSKQLLVDSLDFNIVLVSSSAFH